MLHIIFAMHLWVWISYTEKTILSEYVKFLHYVDWALCLLCIRQTLSEVCDDCVCFSRCVVMVWDASPDSLPSLRICRGSKGMVLSLFCIDNFLTEQFLPDFCLVKQYIRAFFFSFLFFCACGCGFIGVWKLRYKYSVSAIEHLAYFNLIDNTCYFIFLQFHCTYRCRSNCARNSRWWAGI